MAAPLVTGILGKMRQWSPSIPSLALKTALLVNTIPVKIDNDASRPLGGYSTTVAGFGLVNGFSPTNYYSGEESGNLVYTYSSLTYSTSQPYQDYTISVPSGTKKLCVCLTYNDYWGDAIQNDLDLGLISPGSTTPTWFYDYHPSNALAETPLEKMVVENPASGNWTIRVKFYAHASAAPTTQWYSIQGKLIYKTPALEISNIQSTYYTNPNQNISLSPTVTNTGGYIAAGVNLIVNAPGGFSGSIDTTRYVENLMYQGDSKTLNNTDYPPFIIRAPNSNGTFNLSITAKAINIGVSDVTFPFTVVVVSPPSAPTLSSPSNGATNQPTTLTLSWNASSGAISYCLQVDDDINFGSPIYNQSGLTATSQQVSGLSNSTTYYWRVNATNAGGTSSWSSTWNFITVPLPPPSPILISPLNGSINQPLTCTLRWRSASTATSYRVHVDDDPSYLSPFFDQSGILDTFVILVGLAYNTTYYWQVNASNAGGTGPWSLSWYFTTIVTGIEENFVISIIPREFFIDNNKPNPFSRLTEIHYGIPYTSKINITIFSSTGVEIITLVNNTKNPGWYSVRWDGRDSKGIVCPNGIYFYRLETSEYQTTRKMLMLK